LGFTRQLVAQRAPHGLGEAQQLAARPHASVPVERVALRAAGRRSASSIARRIVGVHVLRTARRIGKPGARALQRGLHVARHLGFERRPLGSLSSAGTR
jgi:hypothetical protein